MITDNFKSAILASGALYYADRNTCYYGALDIARQYYFKDYNGNLVHLGTSSVYCYYQPSGSAGIWTFFRGGLHPLSGYTKALQDYANEEDMIASKNFYINGGRSQTRTENSRDDSIYYARNNIYSYITGDGMMILGSGDTPPTKEDYKLESWIPTMDLKPIAYGTQIPQNYDDEFIGGFWGTFYNSSQENKIVKEIGIISSFFANQTDKDTSQTKILMIRDVLENPVIIKPKEGCTFSVIIK